MSDRQDPLETWVAKLKASGLPIFSETARQVSGIATARESSAADLAGAVGRDAALAARLLKIANSPMFNLQNRSIDTIGTAVVLIGFDAIRELALSLALIEEVLKGRRHARVSRAMSRAFHAAAQARSFAASRGDDRPEEVFVAALLLHIGEMAFWATAGDDAAVIEDRLQAGAQAGAAEAEVLGFRLDELTRRLVEEWHLGTLLERAACGKTDDPRAGTVLLGHQVAAAVEESGWESAAVTSVLRQVAKHLGRSSAAVAELVGANAEEAARIAARYGVPAVESYLLEHDPADSPANRAAPQQADPARQRTQAAAPDPAVQLDTLKRIAELLEGQLDLSELLRLVLRGVCDGVGLRRAFFALLTADRKALQVKHAVGGCEGGTIALEDAAGRDLFRAALESGKLVHVTADDAERMASLLTPEIQRRVATPFVVMPVRVADRAVGLLYADNGADDPLAIDAEALSGFRHFGQQIALALASRRA